jgi:hypothetical protein
MADEESGTRHISETANNGEDEENNIVKTQSSASGKGDSSIVAIGPNHETARVIDHKAERALCRKFDYRLLPVLSFMCKSIFPPAGFQFGLTYSDRSVQCARQGKLGKCGDGRS